jgi:orotate phosphoribosyltransferase
MNSTKPSDWLLQKFKDSDALLSGHFALSSGLHSPKYLQCALALQRPADAEVFAQAITIKCRGVAIDTVASPAIGGLIIGYAVAQALGTRFVWTERQNGEMTLRRGFTLSSGERILVVEDVITTGGSTRECIAALQTGSGKVVGAASVVDRSGGKADVGVPRVSLIELDIPTFSPDECPLCEAGIEVTKPGSRTNPTT